MSIRPIGSDSQNTILNTSQTEVPLQTVEASPEPAADDGLRIEAQWHNQLQRLHVLARLAQSTNGQTSGPGVSRPQADATAKKTVDEQAAAPHGPQKTDGRKAPRAGAVRKNVAAASIDGKTSDPIVLQLEVTAARAPASAEALRYLLACELVEAVYRQAGIQISRAAAEAVAVRLLAQGIDFTGRYDRNGQVVKYPQDGVLPQPTRRADGKMVYRLDITAQTVSDLLAYRALAEEVSRSGALSMRESDLLMRVKRALEIALERGYLPEELRRALREQVSLDQLTALLMTGATLGALERAGLRGVAGWIGIALKAKQDLELLVAWNEFLAACARARSEEELDQAARLGGRLFGELGAAAVVQAAVRVGKLVGRVGAHAASERLSRMAVERLDELHGGHSLRRHGAHLSDQELLERLTKGKVPGEGGRVQRNAVSASTRFASSRLQVQTYRKAIDMFIKQRGELTVPPRPNEKPKQTLIIEWDRPIDEGFVGVGQKVKLANGQRVWAQTAAVDGITRTWTRFEWNAQEGRWKVVQHFPLTKGWDNTTKSYDPKEEVTFVGIPVD